MYSSTVASGDDDPYYALLERERRRSSLSPPAPRTARGLSSEAPSCCRVRIEHRGALSPGCSNEMDVGNEARGASGRRGGGGATSARLFVSDRNVIAHRRRAPGWTRSGRSPRACTRSVAHGSATVGSSTTRRAFDETWLAADASPGMESREAAPARCTWARVRVERRMRGKS